MQGSNSTSGSTSSDSKTRTRFFRSSCWSTASSWPSEVRTSRCRFSAEALRLNYRGRRRRAWNALAEGSGTRPASTGLSGS
jgi:hypothetical protein